MPSTQSSHVSCAMLRLLRCVTRPPRVSAVYIPRRMPCWSHGSIHLPCASPFHCPVGSQRTTRKGSGPWPWLYKVNHEKNVCMNRKQLKFAAEICFFIKECCPGPDTWMIIPSKFWFPAHIPPQEVQMRGHSDGGNLHKRKCGIVPGTSSTHTHTNYYGYVTLSLTWYSS